MGSSKKNNQHKAPSVKSALATKILFRMKFLEKSERVLHDRGIANSQFPGLDLNKLRGYHSLFKQDNREASEVAEQIIEEEADYSNSLIIQPTEVLIYDITTVAKELDIVLFHRRHIRHWYLPTYLTEL